MDTHFEGQLTPKDLLEMSRLAWKSNLWSEVVFYLYIALMGTIFLMMTARGFFDFGVGFELVLLAIFATYRFWLPYWTAATLRRGGGGLLEKIQGTVSDEGLTIQARNAASTIRWDYFGRIKRSKNFILLYHSNGAVFNFLGRSFFSTADWEAVNRAVELRVRAGQLTDVVQTATVMFFGKRLGKTATAVFLLVIGVPALVGLLLLVVSLLFVLTAG